MSYYIIIRGPLGSGKSTISEKLAHKLDAKHVLPEVKQLLDDGKIVVFDACFYHKEVIEHLVQSLPYEHYIFTLKAPLELCVQRDNNRHKTHGEGAAAAVHSLVSRFDYGTNIDVTRGLESTLKDILSYLPKPKNYIA